MGKNLRLTFLLSNALPFARSFIGAARRAAGE